MNSTSLKQPGPGGFVQKLQIIPESEWPELRDLYAFDWPKHILSFNTLQNYIKWLSKDPKMRDVRILTTDNMWRQHGTYILEDRNKLRYNVHINTLSPKKHNLMMTALKCLDPHPAYTLTGYTEHVRPIVENHLRDLSVTDFSVGYCPTLLYYLPLSRCSEIEIPPLESGFVVRPLKPKYATQINNLWPHKHPGSDLFIKRVITLNPTFGIFDENGKHKKLCAWVMQLQLGTIGILQVEMEYRRRGFAEHLVRVLCRHMATEGMNATATIMEANTPSRTLFEKLGFKVIDRVYWFDKPSLIASKSLLGSDLTMKATTNLRNG